jgi:hypothetical protein
MQCSVSSLESYKRKQIFGKNEYYISETCWCDLQRDELVVKPQSEMKMNDSTGLTYRQQQERLRSSFEEDNDFVIVSAPKREIKKEKEISKEQDLDVELGDDDDDDEDDAIITKNNSKKKGYNLVDEDEEDGMSDDDSKFDSLIPNETPSSNKITLKFAFTRYCHFFFATLTDKTFYDSLTGNALWDHYFPCMNKVNQTILHLKTKVKAKLPSSNNPTEYLFFWNCLNRCPNLYSILDDNNMKTSCEVCGNLSSSIHQVRLSGFMYDHNKFSQNYVVKVCSMFILFLLL